MFWCSGVYSTPLGLRTNAGNIPTGNGKSNEKNKYIITVDSLLRRYENVLNGPDIGSSSTVTGDESDMMASLRLITAFGKNGNAMFEELKKGLAMIYPTESRMEKTRKMIVKDMENYNYRPTNAIVLGQKMQVKPEIYRYPSLLLLNLRIIYRLKTESTWKTIKAIPKIGIHFKFSDCLFHLFAVSLLIRLKLYLHHDSQCERMSLVYSKGKHKQSRDWTVPEKLFLIYCIKLDPAKSEINLEDLWFEISGVYGRIISALRMGLATGNQERVFSCADLIPQSLFWHLPVLDVMIMVIGFKENREYEKAYKLILMHDNTVEPPSHLRALYENLTVFGWILTLHLHRHVENKAYENKLHRSP